MHNLTKRHLYYLSVLVILFLSLTLRLLPLRDNNFYFTMDQGSDAVHASGITTFRHLPLLGPETSVFGLYAGPLWYYFIALGYALFKGHPFGPVFLLILLNTFLTFIIIRRIAKEVSPFTGVLVGTALQISWWFYDSSRYAFNPSPNIFLAFIALFWLTDFLHRQPSKYVLAAIPIGLFFHTDLASALPVNLFYLGLGLYSVFRHRLSLRLFLISLLVLFLLLTPHFISEIASGFSQTHTLFKELNNPRGVFAGTQATNLKSIYRQIPEIGFLGLALAFLFFFKKIRPQTSNPFIKNFTLLSLGLLTSSWAFFATNPGWRDWHTAFLSPLIFTSLLLTLTQIPVILGTLLLAIPLFFHLSIFISRYRDYLKPSDDPSLLANEIKTLDWAYSHSQDQNFSAYVWIPSVYDYHYQYLFRWYGKKKYGYLPCEFNTYPKAPKTYLPSWFDQREKPANCPSLSRILIMEPDKNNAIDSAWYQDLTASTNLVEKISIGKIQIEKRLLKK